MFLLLLKHLSEVPPIDEYVNVREMKSEPYA